MNMDPLIVSLATLRCTGCGSAECVAIDPGEPPVIDVATDTMLSRGRPVSGRCLACWPLVAPARASGPQMDLDDMARGGR